MRYLKVLVIPSDQILLGGNVLAIATSGGCGARHDLLAEEEREAVINQLRELADYLETGSRDAMITEPPKPT